MNQALPIWRSLLFVPAHISKFTDKAHQRGVDACILDLEDGVALAYKGLARQAAGIAAKSIAAHGTDVLVRINVLEDGGLADLHAVIGPAVCAIVLPKIESAEGVRAVAAELDRLEAQRGMTLGQTSILAQIEDVAALPYLDEIASSSSRLLGMSLGPEDFCVSAGMQPVLETLLWPNQQVAFACRRAGILPFGFPGSISDFSDLPSFRHNIMLARQLGMVGAFCIHPDQVEILNEEFSPSAAEVEYAQGLLAEHSCAEVEGRGAFAYRGKMIDAPVVARAREVLARHLVAEYRRSPTADQ